jgi:hypothetical protein
MSAEMFSLSLRRSCRFLVPSAFLRVVAASSLEQGSLRHLSDNRRLLFDDRRPRQCGDD